MFTEKSKGRTVLGKGKRLSDHVRAANLSISCCVPSAFAGARIPTSPVWASKDKSSGKELGFSYYCWWKGEQLEF